jgi:hypothetical protein
LSIVRHDNPCSTLFKPFVGPTAANGVRPSRALHYSTGSCSHENPTPSAFCESHTVVAMAYFDLDIYQPTRDCFEAIREHCTQGTVIGFDELNDESTPGETLAVKEVLGLNRFSIRRFGPSARTSYLVVDGPMN